MAKQSAEQISKLIKDEVSALLVNKAISRPVLIEAFEDAAADLEGVIECLKDDERRAQQRELG